jgi:hypothetical protein
LLELEPGGGGLGDPVTEGIERGESTAGGEGADETEADGGVAADVDFLVVLLACEPLLACERIRERFKPLLGSPTMKVRSDDLVLGIDTEHHTACLLAEALFSRIQRTVSQMSEDEHRG